jgi:hypothetical protein
MAVVKRMAVQVNNFVAGLLCKAWTDRGLIYSAKGRIFNNMLYVRYIHYLIKSICTYRYKKRQKAVYCSLLSSTSKMGRSGELSDFEYGLVIGCHISKKSVREPSQVAQVSGW